MTITVPDPERPGSSWPADLGRGAVRWTVRSPRYQATVAFYRDLVGLPVIAEFTSSYGEDGTVIGLPDTSVHLEILRQRTADSSALQPADIVLYLDGAAAAATATARLRQAGVAPDPRPHPYWQANGATSYRDPDGRAIVFAPWVFGRVPDPVDRPPQATQIGWYEGDPEALRHLFEEAEDSPAQLDSYLREGRILVARAGDEIVGHLQLVEATGGAGVELKSMAVAPRWRGTGVGRRLVEHAVAAARAEHHGRMVVATAAADIDNLRFYQRRGFRFDGVEHDAFGPEGGYPAGTVIDGIPLRDRIWLAQPLHPPRGRAAPPA